MKLYWTPASPFTRKVCVSARELGLWNKIEVIPTKWTLDWAYNTINFTQGLAESNPVGRIPTLVTNEGVELGDSTLICQYLDSLAPGPLIPSCEDAWCMWSLYAVADGILESQVAMRAELLRPTEDQSEGFLQKQRDRIDRCFDHLEERAEELKLSQDTIPNLAMITVGVACGYQDWRDWLPDFRTGRPKLANWSDEFAVLPSMKATLPEETPEH